MYAFANDRQSCYSDSVLLCMLLMDDFDFLMEHPRTPVSTALETEAGRLSVPQTQPWVCGLRAAMGSPWDEDSPNSAVDFFHALLDMCGVSNIGYQTEKVIRTPRDPTRQTEVVVSRQEGFRAHLAVAGVHTSLTGAFSSVETIDAPSSEFQSVQMVLDLTHARALVVEVGRNNSDKPMHYGESGNSNLITMCVGAQMYILAGVVCRKNGHYISMIWKDSKWWLYDDLLEGENVVESTHPERTHYKPSRYGELFFYK